jgi:hypothetical protein
MTATTIRQNEAVPETWPDAPGNLSTAAAALDTGLIWHRLESYIAWRWTSRAVVWTVEGCGCWQPPLAPATISTVEVWQDDAWQAVTLSPSPLDGYVLPGAGPYRFTGTVGDDAGDVPAGVLEAYRRFAEYIAAKPGKPGASSESVTAGSVSVSIRRSASWMAAAMQNSGAADLLRTYRHV